MTHNSKIQFLHVILILNGLGDLALGLSLLFIPETLAFLLNFHYSQELQYLAGGWGIATLALGGWRISAGRSANLPYVLVTCYFGLFEGALLSLFGIMLVLYSRLILEQVSLSLAFSSFFAVAYAVCYIYFKMRG